MEYTTIEKKVCEQILDELNLIKLPIFLKDEISLIFKRLNNYKVSNIQKNIDLLLPYLNSLTQIYNKEIEKLYQIENARFQKRIPKSVEKVNEHLNALSKEKLQHFHYNMPKSYIKKFGLIYVGTQNDISFESYIKKQIDLLASTRFRLLTMINLTILEYACAPSRITLFQRIMKEI